MRPALTTSPSYGVTCASNESNFAAHIWDRRDSEGHTGATACVVVTSFVRYYQRTKDWSALAWWVHDHVPGYSSMYFFPKLAAFNVSWHEKPRRRIDSYIHPKGCLTKPGMDNHGGSHGPAYQAYLDDLRA